MIAQSTAVTSIISTLLHAEYLSTPNNYTHALGLRAAQVSSDAYCYADVFNRNSYSLIQSDDY